MGTIFGYKIIEEVYRSYSVVVYRAIRERDKFQVILKTHASEYAPVNQILRFRNEFDIGSSLKGEHFLEYYALEKSGHDVALVMEDRNAKGLRDVVGVGALELDDFLSTARLIARALAELHRQGIIHKDIKPSNILADRESRRVWLIDFGVSSRLKRENREAPAVKNPEGTPAYIAPEQTGRMNRPVDYRCDFYALGVTFYLLLTGRLPFESKDPMELIHSHIARIPPPPREIRSSIPRTLERIIMKLMDKKSDQRYQSGYGLLEDLEKCSKSLEEHGDIQDFVIGETDYADRFRFPQKLYGREKESEALTRAFKRANQGRSEMILVNGYSGIGKSALVNEIHKPVTEMYGYFISSGKFEQYRRNIPYLALVDSLIEFCERILGEDEKKLQYWKEKILLGVGENVGVLFDLIPNLELILGPQAPFATLPDLESRNRLNRLMRSFIKAIADYRHPLVIFLDDLQWADLASLDLIALLMSDGQIRNFLLIGAYRDNETDKNHPLIQTIESIQTSGGCVNTIHLKELSPENVEELIGDCFQLSGEKRRELFELVYEKTRGNVFFTIAFLESLWEKKLVSFDYKSRSWELKIQHIKKRDIADNLVDMMRSRIEKLPAGAGEILNLAACLGNRFELGALSLVSELSMTQTLKRLWRGVEEGLILPLDDNYMFFTEELEGASAVEESAGERRAYFKFLHDRVQQAAYFLISEDERKALHLRVGRLLLEAGTRGGTKKFEEGLFEIVNHLNQGLEKIRSGEEKIELVRLNFRAAKKARSSAAFDSARQYLEYAVLLLPENSRESEYELNYSVYNLLASALLSLGKLDDSRKIYQELISGVKSDYERAELRSSLLVIFVMEFKMVEALEEGRTALELLGVDLPTTDYDEFIEEQRRRFEKLLGGRTIDELKKLPAMEDKNYKLAGKILGALAGPIIREDIKLYFCSVTLQANLILERGLTPDSSLAFITYGAILFQLYDDFERYVELGELALGLCEESHVEQYSIPTNFSYIQNFLHWKRPAREVEGLFEKGYRQAREAGNILYSSYYMYDRIVNQYFRGVDIAILVKYIDEHHRFDAAEKDMASILIVEILSDGLSELAPEKFTRVEDENSRALRERVEGLLADPNPSNVFAYFYGVFKLRTKLVLRDSEGMLEFAKKGVHYGVHLQTAHFIPSEYRFLRCLALLILWDEPVWTKLDESEIEELKENIRQEFELLGRWAEHSPDNYLHKYLLLQAEFARVRGENSRVLYYYERAQAEAQGAEFFHDQALVCERAARFCLKYNLQKVGDNYLEQSYYLYGLWGASLKLEALLDEFPRLRLSLHSVSQGESRTEVTLSSQISGESAAGDYDSGATLDIQTLLENSRAVTREHTLKNVQEKILDVLMDEGVDGGDGEGEREKRGMVLLARDGKATPGAERGNGPDSFNGAYCQAAVHWTLTNREALFIRDVTENEKYASDDYLQTAGIKSLLCMPLIKQRKLVGALYLESRYKDIIREKRLKYLSLLSGQFAIVLDNAFLYDGLEELVRERTEELEKTHKQLLETAHRAGMAEVAGGILHNVGNALTGVLVPTSIIRETLVHSRVPSFKKVIALMRANENNLDDFISKDERGQKLPVYLEALSLELNKEREVVRKNLVHLRENLESIKDVIGLQASYTGGEQLREELRLKDVCEDALRMEAAALEQGEVAVWRDFENAPLIHGSRHKLMLILLNLLGNAREAVLAHVGHAREIRLTYEALPGDLVGLRITDNGVGIQADLLEKIFQSGYTTRNHGRGFGLHSAANAATELGGRLSAQSAGPGQGASFLLELPAVSS